MKAITAAVIAILKVNIRFRPLAHYSWGAKVIEVQVGRFPAGYADLVNCQSDQAISPGFGSSGGRLTWLSIRQIIFKILHHFDVQASTTSTR
jgi:hypothetical protein